MKRTWLLGAVAAAIAAGVACEGGIHLEGGNAYPCRFADPPETRDLACYRDPEGIGSWVCGVDDLCRPFKRDEIFFGEYDPRVDPPPLPKLDFSRAARLYPLLPTQPIAAILPHFEGDGPPTALELVYAGSRSLQRVDFVAHTLGPGAPVPEAVAQPAGGFSFQSGEEALDGHAWLDGDGGTIFVEGTFDPGTGPETVSAPVSGLTGAVELEPFAPAKNQLGPGLEQLALVLRAPDGAASPAREAGELVLRPSGVAFAPFELPALADGGTPNVRDVRSTLWAKRRAPLVLADEGLYLRCTSRAFPGPADAGIFSGCEGSGPETWLPIAPTWNTGRPVSLGVSADRGVWSVLTRSKGLDGADHWILHSLRVNETPTGLEVTPAFDSCEPCRRGRAELVTPSSRGGVHADVLCAFDAEQGARQTVVRVVGALSGGACEVDETPASLDPTSVAVASAPVNGLVVVGGTHGQIWLGDTLGDAQPRFLDRAPTAVTRLGGRLMALTDRYVAVEFPGYGMVPAIQPPQERPSAVVENGEGLFVLPSADVVQVTPKDADGGTDSEAEVTFGVRLAGPSGGSASGPFLAYRIPESPGTDAQLVATANDSLYFDEHFKTPAETAPDPMNALVSVLTPEPNFPIRSLAVNDNPEGTDLAQGYLVTSRNLFDFRLDESHRWSVKQIQLPAGEPVEVAMQTPTRVYGRVMYRDGTVFTLPSGFLLAPPLNTPSGSARVLDFEHVYGRPFAITAEGLFVAEPGDQTLPEDSPERYVLWTWKPVELPADAGPFVPGTLHSLREPRDVSFDNETLYLFDEQGGVLRVVDIAVPKPKPQ
ncbi:MAG: hypothetical protein IRZ16_05070 [Myxococcaceae bacterium]|nr:hypothetical protein [Myxococcaceae bacterium]